MQLRRAAGAGSTTAAVIQPSYIPWRGYFDLIRRSDVFVFYDDVQYDKHGWRNRNRIKTAAGLRWLTIPVHAKGNTVARTPIAHIDIDWTHDWRRSHLAQLRHAYAKAPYFRQCEALVKDLYADAQTSLADFTIAGTVRLARFLGIGHTRFVRSSQLHVSGDKTDRLLSVLRQIDATHYLSGPSARAYIEPHKFQAAGISLEYVDYDYAPYEQLHPPYDPGVSILDAIFMAGDDARSHIVPRAAASSA